MSRRLLHWNDVAKQDQPALFMAQGNQTAVTNIATKWLLRADVYIYVQNEEIPATQLNPLLDAVCNAINEVHPVTGRAALPIEGVEYCRVTGTIETDEGTLGSQAVAVIPIEILAVLP
ncbi:MAG: hypothetical protein Q4G42_05155 [Neisseria sp.]|nr:hypothetical protein [Neisseria sp.]